MASHSVAAASALRWTSHTITSNRSWTRASRASSRPHAKRLKWPLPLRVRCKISRRVGSWSTTSTRKDRTILTIAPSFTRPSPLPFRKACATHCNPRCHRVSEEGVAPAASQVLDADLKPDGGLPPPRAARTAARRRWLAPRREGRPARREVAAVSAEGRCPGGSSPRSRLEARHLGGGRRVLGSGRALPRAVAAFSAQGGLSRERSPRSRLRAGSPAGGRRVLGSGPVPRAAVCSPRRPGSRPAPKATRAPPWKSPRAAELRSRSRIRTRAGAGSRSGRPTAQP